MSTQHGAKANDVSRTHKLLRDVDADTDGTDSRVNAEVGFCSTPLHCAAWEGHTDVIKLLLKSGVDVNARDKFGKTALHDAALKGHLAAVKLLLDHGADINSKCEIGSTPLHMAATSGATTVCKLLLERGADPSANNMIAETIFSWATKQGHSEVVAILKAFAQSNATSQDKEIVDEIYRLMEDASFLYVIGQMLNGTIINMDEQMRDTELNKFFRFKVNYVTERVKLKYGLDNAEFQRLLDLCIK